MECLFFSGFLGGDLGTERLGSKKSENMGGRTATWRGLDADGPDGSAPDAWGLLRESLQTQPCSRTRLHGAMRPLPTR